MLGVGDDGSGLVLAMLLQVVENSPVRHAFVRRLERRNVLSHDHPWPERDGHFGRLVGDVEPWVVRHLVLVAVGGRLTRECQ